MLRTRIVLPSHSHRSKSIPTLLRAAPPRGNFGLASQAFSLALGRQAVARLQLAQIDDLGQKFEGATNFVMKASVVGGLFSSSYELGTGVSFINPKREVSAASATFDLVASAAPVALSLVGRAGAFVRATTAADETVGVAGAGASNGMWRVISEGPDPSMLRVHSANGTGLLEQSRDALGRFLPTNGGEISPGSLAEAAVWDAVEAKSGWTVVRGRIYATDAAGQIRVYDGYAQSPSGRVIGLEVKSGTSRLTADQRAFDGWLNSGYQNKAAGIGEHAGLQIDRALEIRWP